MGRKKVKLQWIADDTARKITYQKRVKNLMKKVMELSVLCGVDACAVVNSPYDPRPEVWPSPSEAARVLREFDRHPDNDQVKKRLDQENFLRQRVAKVAARLLKQQKKNKEMEMEGIVDRWLAGDRTGLQGLSAEASRDLVWSIEGKLKEISRRAESFHQPPPPPQQRGGGRGGGDPAAVSVAQQVPFAVALETLMENQILTGRMETRPPPPPPPPQPQNRMFPPVNAYPISGENTVLPDTGLDYHDGDTNFWGFPFLP